MLENKWEKRQKEHEHAKCIVQVKTLTFYNRLTWVVKTARFHICRVISILHFYIKIEN
mgnify:CR=1 FL=1